MFKNIPILTFCEFILFIRLKKLRELVKCRDLTGWGMGLGVGCAKGFLLEWEFLVMVKEKSWFGLAGTIPSNTYAMCSYNPTSKNTNYPLK